MFDNSLIFAEDLMTRDVATVHPETSLLTAVKLMATRHISGLPVVDDVGKPVGMLTEGDLLRWHGEFSERQAWWLAPTSPPASSPSSKPKNARSPASWPTR